MDSGLADIISCRTEYGAKFSSYVCDPDLFVDFLRDLGMLCIFCIFWGPSFKSITVFISNSHVVVN